MLKATFTGNKYRKTGTGNLVFIYAVTGTAKEVQAYISARAKERNIPESEVTKDANGNPLFHFTPNVRSGRVAEKQFNLGISFNGRVVIDDTAQQMTEQKEDRLMYRQALVNEWAKQDATRGATAAPSVAPAAKADVLDEVITEEGAEQTLQTLQSEPAGTEKLAD